MWECVCYCLSVVSVLVNGLREREGGGTVDGESGGSSGDGDKGEREGRREGIE